VSELEDKFPGGDWTRQLVRQSLSEDVGPGDATTEITVDPDLQTEALVVARQPGVVAGLPLLDILFAELDPAVQVKRLLYDGTAVRQGQSVAWLKGPARAILTGERTALNFLQHLGGIATLTSQYVQQVAGTSCMVLDTRKTLPGYRHLAKYAVLCGGGHNHRMGLYDRVMLKDNHWAAAEGSIEALVARSREQFPDLAIEVEVDDLQQLDRVLPLNVEWILLDNFDYAGTAEAVVRRDRAGVATLLESSGNVDLETIGHYARAGVDAASVGRLTHSAPALDLGLDLGQDPR
jgi:nicotinate-nucleotide pyrophosphorylase (carboxylating)